MGKFYDEYSHWIRYHLVITGYVWTTSSIVDYDSCFPPAYQSRKCARLCFELNFKNEIQAVQTLNLVHGDVQIYSNFAGLLSYVDSISPQTYLLNLTKSAFSCDTHQYCPDQSRRAVILTKFIQCTSITGRTSCSTWFLLFK